MLHQPHPGRLPVLLQPEHLPVLESSRLLHGFPSFSHSSSPYSLPILSLVFLFPAPRNSCFQYLPKFPTAIHSYRCSNQCNFLLSPILVTGYFSKTCTCYFSVLPSSSKRQCTISWNQSFFILFLSNCEPVILKVCTFRRILILYGTVDTRQSRDMVDSVASRIQTWRSGVRISAGPTHISLLQKYQTVSGTQSASCSMFIVVLSWGYNGQGVTLITHIHLLLRLTWSGAIIVFHLYNFKWRAGSSVDTKKISATFFQSRTPCQHAANERPLFSWIYFTNMLTPCDQQVSDLCRLSVFSCVIAAVSGKEPTIAEF